MFRCSADFLLLAKQFIDNSGRGLFHKGHYQDCLAHPHMKYSFIQPGYQGQPTNSFIGLCLPRSCPDHLITKGLDAALATIGIPFTVYDIDSNTENYEFPLNWVSYLTLFLLTALVLLVVGATLRYWRAEKKGRNRWLGSFDAISNVQQHFKVRQSEDLNVWDGVRAIAMMWVVIGHTYEMSIVGGSNLLDFKAISVKPFLLVLEAGIFSVDIFFSLGGFFLAFILLRNKITGQVCGFGILQRALRIWPAYILAMMFYYSLLPKVGSGIFWGLVQKGTDICSTMWREVLFLSNFIQNGERSCMPWGWYLQVDFQLFVAGIFLLYLYSKDRRYFTAATIFLGIASTVFVFVYGQIHSVKMTADLTAQTGTEVFNDTYIKPHARCVPYLMGLLLGAYFMEYRNELKSQPDGEERSTLLWRVRQYFLRHDKVRIVVQWSGIGLMAFVSFIPRPVQMGAQWPQVAHSFYNSLSKPFFILGVFLTALPSILGIHHSFFNLTLNAKIFVLIARISFCTYLVHIFILFQYIYSRTYDTYYGLIDIFIYYSGLLVLCLLCGFLATVMVEVPLGNVLKIAMAKLRKSKKEHHRVKEQSLITNDSLIEDHPKAHHNSNHHRHHEIDASKSTEIE